MSSISFVCLTGDFCDYIVTITIAAAGSNASTDLGVEIIMPENNTIVMQMSKPQITYVGGNFVNSQNLYNPAITMTSQQNSSQVKGQSKSVNGLRLYCSSTMLASILELL